MFLVIIIKKNCLQHGRVKVKTTAEQQEAKRKEREEKVKLYKAATNKIFYKKVMKFFELIQGSCQTFCR